MSNKILVIEDEAAIADNIVYALKTEGYEVTWHKLGLEGIEFIKKQQASLVILDIGLPDMSGFEVCKKIRQFSQVPIIFLTARNEEIDRVVGLEIGGDDYVTKPFSPRELVARVKVILKRVHADAGIKTDNQAATEENNIFHIDEKRAQIRFFNQSLELTRYEYLILKILLQSSEQVFSREQLMNKVWDSPDTSLDRAVDTHIKSIRSKLRDIDNSYDPIKTHRGLGYSLVFNKHEN